MTTPLVDLGLALCQTALRTAGVGWSGLSQVLLAGGSTLLPNLDAALRRVSGLGGDRFRRHHPQQAVAFGAALIAAGRGGAARPVVQRTAGADLGSRVLDPATRRPTVDIVIPANTPIPARKAVTYHSNRADQARMVFEVVQVTGRRSEPISLGHFAFALERPRKNHPLEVTLGYDELGMVAVQARDPDTGQEVLRGLGDPTDPNSARLRKQADIVASVRLLD